MAEVTKEQVVEYLSSLPVMEIANLVKELEDKWGVSAAPIVQQGGGNVAEEAVEEQTEFDVVLESFGEEKMKVIKQVRDLTQKGLKEAKELVESAPVTILEAIDKKVAEETKSKIEGIGSGIKVALK